MRTLRGLLAASALLGLAQTSMAQSAPVALKGVAWDSLRREPLGAATLTLTGQGDPRTTVTDKRGRFQFDSVGPGAYTLQLFHAELDTIGFSGIKARVTVTDGKEDARIAVPSFATIWKGLCGDRPAPRDSGIVFGVIRNAADRAPVPDAFIQLVWLDLSAVGTRRFQQVRYRQLARSVSTGAYGICGVPNDAGIRIQAATDSTASGALDVPFTDLHVRRVDLVIGPTVDDSLNRGVVTGFISDTLGNPFPNARVHVDGVNEVKTQDNGRFRVTKVPLGTRQVDVIAIGVAPERMNVDVVETDTAFVLAKLQRVTLLDVIRVTASRQYKAFIGDLEERKKSGLGYFRDSTEISQVGTLMGVFNNFPSTEVRQMGRGAIGDYVILLPGKLGRRCAANLWIDGRRADYSEMSMMRPDDFAVVEVYPRDLMTPMKFQTVASDCGAVAIWTKRGLPR